MSAVDGLARFMFDRQAAAFGAEPALTELAWVDEEIRAFWIAEATAVLDHLGATAPITERKS